MSAARSEKRTALLISLWVCTSCAGVWTEGTKASSPHQSRSDITGLWQLELTVDNPGTGDSGIDSVAGIVALVRGAALQEVQWPGLPAPAYAGTYALELEPLGVIPVSRRDIRIVGASLDSNQVTIVLNPGVDHGALVMSGSIRADSVSGSWRITAYALGATGRFIMRRI
jgi:hypothetical protein